MFNRNEQQHRQMIGAIEFLLQETANLVVEVRLSRKIINERLSKIMATQDQEAAALNAVSDQLTKAMGELTTALGNLGQTSPEVDAATAKLQAAAQALDDLEPDAPPAPPEGA